jgi:hypothetical protein
VEGGQAVAGQPGPLADVAAIKDPVARDKAARALQTDLTATPSDGARRRLSIGSG